jgi:hypothetical protein
MYMGRIYAGILSCLTLFLAVVFAAPYAQAADPQFFITWKADTRVPVWYAGKALPVQDSTVLISLSLVDQSAANGGKLIDLSTSEIRWYLKGELAQKGKGLTSLSINNRDFAGNNIDLKVSVAHTDEAGSRFIDSFALIPIVRPEAVVEHRSLQPFFAAGSDVVLKGHPFFFTSSLLKPEWNIGGAQTVQNAYDVRISAAPAQLGRVVFSVRNPEKQLEQAEASVVLQAN